MMVLSGVAQTNLVDFALEWRERIRTSGRVANDNALVAQSKVVDLEVGQQVLWFLSWIWKLLEAMYAVLYVVLERLRSVDCLVAIPHRRKSKRVVNVTLVRKCESGIDCVPSLDVSAGVSSSVCVIVSESSKLEEVFENCLSDFVQCDEVLVFQNTFEGVFNDGSCVSVKESESAWASSIVHVPNSDVSFQLCTDLCKFKALTAGFLITLVTVTLCFGSCIFQMTDVLDGFGRRCSRWWLVYALVLLQWLTMRTMDHFGSSTAWLPVTRHTCVGVWLTSFLRGPLPWTLPWTFSCTFRFTSRTVSLVPRFKCMAFWIYVHDLFCFVTILVCSTTKIVLDLCCRRKNLCCRKFSLDCCCSMNLIVTYLNIGRHLNLFTDLVCRFTFGD